MIVVKVGGSLFERPTLRHELNRYLATLTGPVMLVAGGGPSAEAVRTYDRIHGLGEATSHRLAIESLAVTRGLLLVLTGHEVPVLDVVPFALADELLPHSWAVTTDSIAARYAETIGATRLILLKSVAIPPGTDWPTAAANGWVDEFFPTMAKRLACPIEAFQFR
jgi:aspartokinase-like uncharacterized kinase